MVKSLRTRRDARTVRGWLIAAAGFASTLAGAAAPARAADDDPYPETPGTEIACTDPAALSGGRLDPILATQTNLIGKPPLDPGWAAFVKPLDAPFVSLPGIASGHCVEGPGASYLSVSINSPHAPGAWPATLPGNLVMDGRLLKSWGWHIIDVNVAMGNLIGFVSTLRKPGL
jgi:hypothetical protein